MILIESEDLFESKSNRNRIKEICDARSMNFVNLDQDDYTDEEDFISKLTLLYGEAEFEKSNKTVFVISEFTRTSFFIQSFITRYVMDLTSENCVFIFHVVKSDMLTLDDAIQSRCLKV